jgi:hypothetical protein
MLVIPKVQCKTRHCDANQWFFVMGVQLLQVEAPVAWQGIQRGQQSPSLIFKPPAWVGAIRHATLIN